MVRKIAFILMVICAVPILASAATWSLSTRVMTVGGSMQVRDNTPQTSANGTVFKSYTTSQNIPVTVIPATGYKITEVKINGAVQTLPLPSNPFNMGLIAYPTKTAQGVTASFAKNLISVSATAGAGGSVLPSGTANYAIGAAVNYTFTPNSGLNVISISGAPTGALFTDVSVTPNVPVTLPAPINHAVKVSFTVPSTSITLSGVFLGVAANAGLSQTILIGQTATLNGSSTIYDGSSSVSYAWSQVSGPSAGTLTNAASATAQFSAAISGTYTLKLQVTSSNGATNSATTTVMVANSATTIVRTICETCHASAGVGPGVYQNWSSSKHKAKPVMCAQCHIGADTGAHPGTLMSGTVNGNTFNYTGTNNNFCVTCHNPAITSDFAASKHSVRAGSSSCSFCHVQGVHNPDTKCVNCHTPGNTYGLPWPPTGLDFHNDYTGTELCTNCHNQHNPKMVTGMPYPHFSTYTTAQYVTKNISCDNCHKSADAGFNVYPATREWAKSGKANPISPAYIGTEVYTEATAASTDFKFLGTSQASPATSTSKNCVRCHTTTGFVNYVTSDFTNISPWGEPGDRRREMIACSSCHISTTGFDAAYSRRSIGIELNPLFYPDVKGVAAWYGYSSAATKKIIRPKSFLNPAGAAMNDSDLCIVCHSGTSAGDLIKVSSNCTSAPSIACRVGATGSYWDNVDFIDSHNLSAANIMFPDGLRAGYDYRVGTSSSPFHANIGLGNTQGPCVGCHMTSPKKHSFSVLSSASTGVIASVSTNVCATCHGSSVPIADAEMLQSKKAGFQAALTVIATQLAAKGIYYNAAKAPYFFTTPDQAQQTSANRTVDWNFDGTFQGANLFGAAFNLRLLQQESGWVHNPTYTKRLLYDTIDYLDDGNATNNTVLTTIQNLSIDPAIKTKAVAYMTPRI